MKTMRFWAIFAVALLALATIAIPKASADQYFLTIDQCTGTCGLPAGSSYGTVDVNQYDSTTNEVDILVTLTSGIRFVNTGFDGSFFFNLVGSPTISVAVANPVTDPVSFHALPKNTYQVDGFGDFQYAIYCDACDQGGSHPQTGPLEFTVTNTGGSLSPADFKQLSTVPPGSIKVYFAADVIGTNGKTGPVGTGESAVVVVPEPGSIALFGMGLLGAGVAIRRRRK